MNLRKIIFLCMSILLIFYSTLSAQSPKIDVNFKKNMIARKAKHYQQLILNEKLKTANQDNYDIKYYSLDLTPDPETSILDGIVEIQGEVTASMLDFVELNFWDAMSVTSLRRFDNPGVQLNYTRNNNILTVYLDRDYLQGETFGITISYTGRPGDYGYGYFNFDTYDGEPMIWTISSVFGARIWWPCKDIASDKPDSMDIRVTVPDDLIVVSNGALRQVQTAGNQKTYWWHENYPISTYLVSLAIHPYEVHYDEYVYNNGTDTMSIHFYNFQGNFETYYRINNLVKDILYCYSELFGEYPFADEKYAQADFLWGGGMEHQTCTSYGTWNESLYAHEIAHQWWGDMITCETFHHIWLNEGFASYCEALWFEYTYPPYTASEYQMMYQLYLGPGTVYVEDPENENIFDIGLSYVKGSWVLHMLRHVVGDDGFFEILKAYYNSPEHKYGTARTEGFQAICEQVSGMDLDRFFHQWIYEENFPDYSYSWSWVQDGPGYKINLEIRQDQTNYIFWMPIDVTVTTTEGETTFVVWDSLATQSFILSTSSEPISLVLDKDNWILKRIPDTFENPAFDEGILLVNGVSFETYGEEIRNSYENRTFWGDFHISFWDCFNPPLDGYPSTLPEPLGYGKVPGDVLGHYSTVIWVSSNYGGDIGSWQQTSILPYLEAGGNLLLMTRMGQDYFDTELQNYIGIRWAEHPLSTVNNCIAVYPGLIDMLFTGDQTYNAVFETGFNSNESVLLFQETASFGVPRGLGVWHKPEGGGTFRSEGGNFVFISGRPYRYDAVQLRSNVEFILRYLFHESRFGDDVIPGTNRLEQNYPNPFTGSTTIEYYLAQSADVTINIYNVQGRLVKSLLEKQQTIAGYNIIEWDGKNDNGKIVSSGVYFYQIKTADWKKTKKMVLIR